MFRVYYRVASSRLQAQTGAARRVQLAACHRFNSDTQRRVNREWVPEPNRRPEETCPNHSYSTDSTVEQADTWQKPTGFDTGVKVYNSLTKTKCPLILPKGQVATWYVCGPTVYDSAHIGHACSYVRFDFIRRILNNMFNVDVILAMGITDIDDKIINKSNELGTDFLNVSRKYEMEFMRDMASVNVQSPLATLRVTEFIPHIIQYIQQIINNGFGYVTDSGNVLFDVNKYGQYGKLWTHSMDTEIREAATTEKRSPRDFALWKSAKPGEPWWQAPWGRGRPGWHIECSTIASSVYGRNVDIHSGGDDLRFPHHENELAQSQSYYCCNQWVNYWIHCGHLHLKYDADKMSKSLKNYVTVPDLLSKYTPNQFRIFCLLSHYRKRIDYSDEIMQKSVSINRQLTAFLECADSYIRGNSNVEPINDSLLWESLAETQRVVRSALADDFDTPRAMEAIKTLLRKGNIELGRHTTNTDHVRSPTVIAALVAFIHRFTDTLGIQLTTRQAITDNMKDQQLTSVLDNVVKFRSAIRQQALKHRKSVSKPMKKSSQTNSEHDQNNENSDSTSQIENNNHHQISDDMLESCDKFREDLVVCGVQIKDRGKDSSWQILEDQPLKEKAADSGKASS